MGANTDIRSDAREGWGLSITRTAGAVRADLSLALIEALIIIVSIRTSATKSS